MRRPKQKWDQYVGKAHAEAARGSGLWPLQPHPCSLEPPWDRYDRDVVNQFDCWLNHWDRAWEPSLIKRLLAWARIEPDGAPSLSLAKQANPYSNEHVTIKVEQFSEDEVSIPKAQEFLRSLLNVRRPVSFELVGLGEQPVSEVMSRARPQRLVVSPQMAQRRTLAIRQVREWNAPCIVTQFVVHRTDAAHIERQLVGHFPNSAVTRVEDHVSDQMSLAAKALRMGQGAGSYLSLQHYHVWPIRILSRLDVDPVGVAIAAMEQLGRWEWSAVQVIFVPTRFPWESNLSKAVSNPYERCDFLLPGITEKLLREKFASPLFAVSVRLAACRHDLLRQLFGWADQFSMPPQGLACIGDFDSEPRDLKRSERQTFADSVENRCTFRPGMLLNTEELAGLVHLPGRAVASARLCCVTTRTRPAPECQDRQGSVQLGTNVHRGKVVPARLSADLRSRHCYITGASGTGKSTFILNLVVQDIQAGAGCAILDPHGDLINAVLERIPAHRINDVTLFDPADDQFPFALNILESKDESERERIVNETVMALKRYFPSSWGPRLQQILTFALYTVLESIPGATLADVERLLTIPHFREITVARLRTPQYANFWKYQFGHYPKNAVEPVLNKLTVFLINATVRNIICQRHSAIDFDQLLNSGKILLANLSTGLLTEELSGMLGSFLVTKIVNAAFRRARLPEHTRRPFFLYVDEFQAFMNVSVGFDRILAEARKQRLTLTAANQFLGQLSTDVRQAVFGNVGTMVVFRVGVDDAETIARELGAFTSEEILSLDIGQAIVRPGKSSTTFNLQTFPPPPVETTDSAAIRRRMRSEFARPRAEVEAILRGSVDAVDTSISHRHHVPEPTDPNEDDLVA